LKKRKKLKTFFLHLWFKAQSQYSHYKRTYRETDRRQPCQ